MEEIDQPMNYLSALSLRSKDYENKIPFGDYSFLGAFLGFVASFAMAYELLHALKNMALYYHC